MRFILVFAMFLCGSIGLSAQSTAYVIKSGMTIGTQKWGDVFQRQLLFKYHAALAIESVDNENDNYSLFFQIGYHVKGSATRFRYFYGSSVSVYKQEFRYNNLSFSVGAKQKFLMDEKTRYYYFGALRGDYTLSTNIDELSSPGSIAALYYPQIGGVQRFMGGFSLGGGLEITLSDLVGMQIEFSVNPDFTNQYRQPAIGNVIDPANPGNTTTIPERRIKNTTLELSVGLRLLKKVIYED